MRRRSAGSIAVAASVVAMAGFFAMKNAQDGAGRDSPPRSHAHRLHSGADEASGRPRPPRERKAKHSFQQRAAEIGMMKQTTDRDDCIRKLALEWAAQDPLSAEQWASSLAEQNDRPQALNLVCMTLSGHSPVEAIAMAGRNHLGEPIVETIVSLWATRDFPRASEWVASTTGDTRNKLLPKLAIARAEAAPEEAATLVALSMQEGQSQEEAAMSVLHQWLRKDPQAAAAWIGTFPDGPLKERGQTEIEGMRASVSGQ